MPLFYKLLLALLISAGAVLTYDLFQAQIEEEREQPRLVFDARAGRFTFEKPAEPIRIIYASMFGPGEPVMRVRDKWISRFEEEYGARLAASPAWAIPAAERPRFVADVLDQARQALPEFRQRLAALDAAGAEQKGPLAQDLAAWLESRRIVVSGVDGGAPPQEQARTLHALLAGLETLARSRAPADEVTVAPRVKVTVERRWQGRWVLSANRPRFLTGREVPDVIEGGKTELRALVQDDYAVPLDVPLAGETVSPLDGPDTWGRPERPWRAAFIPSMLQDGKYPIDDPVRRQRIYFAPLVCYTYGIFYNEVLFKRAGIERPPRTWPEFIAVCEKVKAAGIHPLTADMENYSDVWMTWLIYRALGPEAWQGTIAGVPSAGPGRPRVSDPPWTDARYREVFSQIRLLRDRGYFDRAFAGSAWPAAQRAFASGSAAMMLNGSWLVQELGGYEEAASARTFKLSCFSFPQWPGGRPQDQTAALAGTGGVIVCRQGKATGHAIELVKYLSARDHPDMVHENAQISCMKDADFPPALAGVADDFRNAPIVYTGDPRDYAPRFSADVLLPTYVEFFLAESASVDALLARLARKSAAYLENGGERGYE
jgi:ABC-type glycerol-3-phosphate transport system substrate-binding protein